MKSDFQIDVSRLTSPTATQLFWLHHLEQWQKTTLSLADYARQQDLKYINLNSWLRWVRKHMMADVKLVSPLLFNKVSIINDKPALNNHLSVYVKLPNGIAFEMNKASQEDLLHLLSGLASLSL